jgi:hypothetical protein
MALRPQTTMHGVFSAALLQFIGLYVSDGRPWLMVTDATNMLGADAETRRMGREFFGQHRDRMRYGLHGANVLVRTMFNFFITVCGLQGRAFATRKDALSWLDVAGDYPSV